MSATQPVGMRRGTVKAGEPLVHLIVTAYRADLPVLMHARHGVGKSSIVQHAADVLGVASRSVTLSTLEPTDLSGLPRYDEATGRTVYASPALLPHDGAGLLLIEELNRVPSYLQGPCLELLTARRLNDYILPPGWLPLAAVNDAEDGDYAVGELDPALASRFIEVAVAPDAHEWVTWAREHEVHPSVIRFVADMPDMFVNPDANPRAFEYASRLLRQADLHGTDMDTVRVAICGILKSEHLGLALLRVHAGSEEPLAPEDITHRYPACRAAVRQWKRRGRNDLLAASLTLLQRHLQPQRRYDALVRDPQQTAHVEAFFADLPAELRRCAQEWLDECGFTGLRVPQRARGGP